MVLYYCQNHSVVLFVLMLQQIAILVTHVVSLHCSTQFFSCYGPFLDFHAHCYICLYALSQEVQLCCLTCSLPFVLLVMSFFYVVFSCQ